MGPDGGVSVFIASEMGFGGKVVKGSPYSAQAITEAVQTLADGNRIVRKTTASVYRDSEGRTRQDQSVGNIGPYAVAGEPRQVIFINDPVSNVNYVLDARDKTARKMSFSRIESFQRKADSDKATAEKTATVDMAISSAAGGANVAVAGPRRPPMRDKVWVGEGKHFQHPAQGAQD